MLFQVYGDTAIYQWIGWILVFCCLIGANELARRTKTGGVIAFLIVPAILTIYFITIYVAAAMGAEWALSNPTYVHMTSWFHYAKLYAATAGCIGFMALKYKWGKIGKSEWFKCFPFVIVAINILIAVASDFESAIRAWGTTWVSTEGVTLYGGWHNVFNGVAGLINLQLPADPLLVLRPRAAARPDRGELLLEQGRLDSEPRQHARHLVHVRAGVPHVPG